MAASVTTTGASPTLAVNAKSKGNSTYPSKTTLHFLHHSKGKQQWQQLRIASRHFTIATSSTASSAIHDSAVKAASIDESIRNESREILIESEIGESYEVLRSKLAAGEWEAADSETRRLLCLLAGEAAAKRKWVYFTEVQFIPAKDLLTIDRLWRSFSDDRFGYSVQRRLWKAFDQRWKPFFLKIGWTYGINSTYKKFPMEFSWNTDAPIGHLPLTNALRGTQLFEALFLHPAFAVFDSESVMPEDLQLPTFTAESMGNEPSTATEKPRTENKDEGEGYSILDAGFNSSDYGF